jgi:hypothetical protein
MIAGVRDRPAYRLTRHFFRALFDLGVLSEQGADAFTRLLLGAAGILLALGLVLTRMYMGKYAMLSLTFRVDGGPRLYREALLADNGMVLALAMWVVAVVTVLVSHSLFPDETDFRVLMPLPVTRRTIFASKLAALTLFAGLFIVTTLAALSPIMLMMSASRWSVHTLWGQMLSYLAAGTGASVFVVLCIVAVSGLTLVCLPRAHVHGGSAIIRSAMLCALVLVAPLVLQTPTLGPSITAESGWLFLAPHMWFVGLERWLVGERVAYLTRLAQVAILAVTAAGLVAAGSYAALYARFDRLMLRSFRGSPAWPWPGRELRRRLKRSMEPFLAVRDFTVAALRRSALHQGIVMGLSACGAALVVNSLINNGVFAAIGTGLGAAPSVLDAVLWAPCAMIFIAAIAVRTAIVVPLEPRANWLFRMTEVDEARADQLDAVAHVMRWLAVGIPVLIAFPMQWAIVGTRSIVTSAIAAACGCLLVEFHMRDWRRIPFTCSYLPGKHAVANSALIGVLLFWIYGRLGAALERVGYASPLRGLIVVGLLAVVVAILRRRRRHAWRVLPLMFEDLMPTQIDPIGLPRE